MNLMYIGAIIATFIIAVIVGLWLPGIQRKYVQARIQQRIGPPVSSPGIFATTKFFLKESVTPNATMPRMYNALPLITLIVVAVLFITLMPYVYGFGAFASVVAIVGLLKVEEVMYLFMSSSSQSILSKTMPFPDHAKGGVHLDAKKSFLEQISANRSLRLVTFGSLPLYLAMFIPVIMAGSMKLQNIVLVQRATGPFLLSVPGIIGAIAFFVGFLVVLNEYPFSYLKGKSDVIDGPILEYMAKSRGVYFIAHSFLLFVGSSIFSTLYLGLPPSLSIDLLGPIVCSIIISMAGAAVSAFSPLFTNREFYPTVVATTGVALVGILAAFITIM
ncbi:MAG: NADH-quinone oxidoreductase subunit H [Methanobacteriaceae archaeon]|nr:NADH-quinone oxidoreductase subunit H [Methanobacteriaceae archaeon]